MIIKCAAVLHTRKSKRLKGLPLELFVELVKCGLITLQK